MLKTLWRGALLPILGCGLFALAGFLILPLLGIENDEALFANVFYEPRGGGYAYRLGHMHLPLMILSYLGTFKSWIYKPIYQVFGIGLVSTRLPAVLGGAATIWLFYRLLYRIAGRRAALIGCGLLVTDAVYLLTSTFDWGPVVLQHLLVLGGFVSLTRFWQDGKESALAWAFFLFGLALWDKALAVWTLSGLAVAASVTLWREIARRVSKRRLGIAALSLCVGALPVIMYNIHTRGGTFHGNARFDPHDLPVKLRALVDTFRGSGLLGYFSPEDWQTPQPHAPRGWLQTGSATLASFAGHPRQSLQLYGFLLALMLIPLARGSALRAILFALIALIAAWLQMAFTAGAGDGLHHTVLLWPLPQVIMAISFAAASRRLGRLGVPFFAAVTTVLMISGLLLINEYYFRMVRNGGTISWTDAIFPLADYMKTVPTTAAYSLDWGFLDSLRMLTGNQVPVRVGEDPINKPELTPADRERLIQRISDPGVVFITHPVGSEFYPGLAAKLVQFAERTGYRQKRMAVIRDSNARPSFEVFRLIKN
jgi:4-amino-4-deoxy-L-arabinose transferase-like glycosyltransferase